MKLCVYLGEVCGYQTFQLPVRTLVTDFIANDVEMEPAELWTLFRQLFKIVDGMHSLLKPFTWVKKSDF